MEQPTFLNRIKLFVSRHTQSRTLPHVTTDFLRGILFLYVVYYVSILSFNISNTLRMYIYGGSEFLVGSWKMSTLAGVLGILFLAFIALAVMLFLRIRQCAKITLAVIAALLAINVFGFFLMVLLKWLHPSPEFPAVAFGTVHVQFWLRDIFIIACALWFYKKWQSEPHAEEESFWKRVKLGATSDFLRGVLVAYATSWAYNSIFALIRNNQWHFRQMVGDAWVWMDAWLKVPALLVALAYCAIVVMLFMQTRRSAKFALVVLGVIFAIKVLGFFAFAPSDSYGNSYAYIVSLVQRWFDPIFFIALAVWFYVKSKRNERSEA